MAQQSQSKDDSQAGTQVFTVPYLAIVPALSITYPWTFVTASLVEQNIFTLAITLVTLFYGGKYLERAWGSAEFGKFLLVVSLVPNFLSFVIYVAWFAATGNVIRS
jgi:membrane associated rhomboid family serine protease